MVCETFIFLSFTNFFLFGFFSGEYRVWSFIFDHGFLIMSVAEPVRESLLFARLLLLQVQVGVAIHNSRHASPWIKNT